VQISGSQQRFLGTRAHRGAGVWSNEVDAQPSDNGVCVVLVQPVKCKAVVKQSRRLKEDLASNLEVHVRPGLSDCVRGRHELIEGRPRSDVLHAAERLSGLQLSASAYLALDPATATS